MDPVEYLIAGVVACVICVLYGRRWVRAIAYFLTGKNTSPIPPPEPVNPFAAFRQIGETFQYCGRRCVVTAIERHWSEVNRGMATVYLGHVFELTADYADDNGVIHTVTFPLSQLSALLAENRPN